MSDLLKIGNKARSLETSPAFAPYTGVILWYDDENAYRAGDDSGRVLEAECPWATQEMADNMLSAISGYVYRPYSATGAILDPAAELGDAVVVGGVCSILAAIDTTFDAMCAADISAPADEEVDHEYPYLTATQRALNRKVTLGKSYYGTKIDRANGLQITRTNADGTETSRAVMNSDTLAFYDANGNPSIYFDAETGKYNFYGDVTVTGGSININDNFVVDQYGNVKMFGVLEWGAGSSPHKAQFSADGETDWHDTMTDEDMYKRESYDGGKTWSAAYKFRGQDGQDGADGSDADVPSYIKKTYISSVEIQSPTITGNEIRALGTFQVGTGSADAFNATGYMGYARGLAASDVVTTGVAMSNTESLEDGDNYVIVTNGGTRMQAGASKIYATDTEIVLSCGGHEIKITADGVSVDGNKIGS